MNRARVFVSARNAYSRRNTILTGATHAARLASGMIALIGGLYAKSSTQETQQLSQRCASVRPGTAYSRAAVPGGPSAHVRKGLLRIERTVWLLKNGTSSEYLVKHNRSIKESMEGLKKSGQYDTENPARVGIHSEVFVADELSRRLDVLRGDTRVTQISSPSASPVRSAGFCSRIFPTFAMCRATTTSPTTTNIGCGNRRMEAGARFSCIVIGCRISDNQILVARRSQGRKRVRLWGTEVWLLLVPHRRIRL